MRAKNQARIQPHIPNQSVDRVANTIQFEHHGTFNDIPACYQTWQLDGMRGESIMFKKKDLKKYALDKLIRDVRASKLAQTHKPITLSHNPPGHLCVIFNFSMKMLKSIG
ncbi:hypothetical protein OS175_12550 [Marinicella sp. S1101]|uniref:hypothetical protein n=1 Tax=Marinicella marina TaxID=2996016 RepID=UPI002260C2EE|nr:hypothetical protein [Marinicella marina]MCX7554712.1 hypothetical protein [Marinicella marina]MDJ1141472.1 hypothetical protein [Marinicella marina]